MDNLIFHLSLLEVHQPNINATCIESVDDPNNPNASFVIDPNSSNASFVIDPGKSNSNETFASFEYEGDPDRGYALDEKQIPIPTQYL